MGVLNNIRNWAYQRSLRDRVMPRTVGHQVNLENAKSIGILFHADDLDQRKTIVRYADRLKKSGKKVRMLGYLSLADKQANFPFTFFTKKNVDWAGRPKGDAVETFMQQGFDLLLIIHPKANRLFEYIALSTPAKLKVGPVPEHPEAHDLMIDVAGNTKLTAFIEQFEGILKITNVEAVEV